MFTHDGLLKFLFKQTDRAGFGIATGANFEAFPGCEDAAADYMQQVLERLTEGGEADGVHRPHA